MSVALDPLASSLNLVSSRSTRRAEEEESAWEVMALMSPDVRLLETARRRAGEDV
jgi:hypothetical protein